VCVAGGSEGGGERTTAAVRWLRSTRASLTDGTRHSRHAFPRLDPLLSYSCFIYGGKIVRRQTELKNSDVVCRNARPTWRRGCGGRNSAPQTRSDSRTGCQVQIATRGSFGKLGRGKCPCFIQAAHVFRMNSNNIMLRGPSAKGLHPECSRSSSMFRINRANACA